jgi:hypothetical protein
VPVTTVVTFSSGVTEANNGDGVVDGLYKIYTVTATSTTSETVTIG